MEINTITPDEAILHELSERLKRTRKQRGFTQEQLATEAGIGVATLRRIEDGQDAQLGSWLKILKALGMAASIEALLPESVDSPMAEALALKRRRRSKKTTSKDVRWGDEDS
jgi:transcriptional regulator with XRE-family HTH domain